MSLQEDLKLIEEALEEIIESSPDSRGPGLRGALDHDFQAIGHRMASGLASGIKKVSDKMTSDYHKSKFETAAKNYNQANANYKAHKASGNAAGMAVAQANMAQHKKQMQSSMGHLNNAGINVSLKPGAPKQKPQKQQQQTQQQAPNKPQQPTQQTPVKKDGPWYSQQIQAARQRGDHEAVRRLGQEYRRMTMPNSASEAYSLAESLIMSLLEGMENRNKGAIIVKKEIIKNGKPHVKGTFVETEIIKDAKGDIPNPKRERICKKASKKAEGAVSAMKREVANELKKLAGQE